jgi:large subunit ribosomal protein L31e
MSQDLERVYTINLGKVLLSPNNQRAKRAINMVKEFARRHMKNEQIKLEEDLSHQIWQRGIRHPPRKIRVKMTKTDEGFILVSPYEEEIEEAVEPKEGKKKLTKEVKPESEAKEIGTKPEVKDEVKEVKEKKPKEEKPKPKESKPKETKSKPKEEKPKPKESKPKEEKPKPKESKPKEEKPKPKESKPKSSKK